MSDLIDKAEALAPCPFCGGKAEMWNARDNRPAWIACMGRCAVLISKEHTTDAAAIAAWNRRALPARGVGVKPLVWTGTTSGTSRFPAWKSDAGRIVFNRHTGWYVYKGAEFSDLPAAKAAAQANYEARILAALEPTPAPTDAAPMVKDVLRLFENCASTLVPIDYANGYREACQHVLEKLTRPTPTDAAQAPAEDAHVKGETTGQMLERLGMDGAKWAAEFRTTALRLGYSDMDEGWLIGWFCNAIMAGYDRSAAQARERALREAAAVAEAILKQDAKAAEPHDTAIASDRWEYAEQIPAAILDLIGEARA